MRDARFRRVRSPESHYKAGPRRVRLSARLPISRLSCNYHVTGSPVPRDRGNQSKRSADITSGSIVIPNYALARLVHFRTPL